ncbi:MAG: DUF4296 domain-containing protein [Chitinophagaceae bacterium]
MIRTAYLFALVLFLFSCVDKDEHIPDGILPQKKMQQVMWDLVRADELVAYQSSLDSSFDVKQRSVQHYARICRIHKISQEDFKQSFRYYQKHPGQLKVVLDSLRNQSERPLPDKGIKPI